MTEQIGSHAVECNGSTEAALFEGWGVRHPDEQSAEGLEDNLAGLMVRT